MAILRESYTFLGKVVLQIAVGGWESRNCTVSRRRAMLLRVWQAIPEETTANLATDAIVARAQWSSNNMKRQTVTTTPIELLIEERTSKL